MAENTKQTRQQETMVRGMAWLTAGNFISRLLGLIYVIPWFVWLGSHKNEANALFNMGYQVYANFLLISTVGLPTAVAKQIAKYNVLEKEEVSYYLVREFFKLMLFLGVVFAGIMYLLSPTLAGLSGAREELTPVMYSLVPPIFIFPAMSIMRGFFQGHSDLKPYAISQIIEQIVRVIWILAGTFYIMKLGSGDYLEAVIQSTLGAFIGMIASVGYLIYVLHKEGYISRIMKKPDSAVSIDIKALVLETAKEAVPIIILGSAFQIYQFIDQITFVNVMKFITDFTKEELLVLYSYMLSNPSKITMVIIGVTSSLGSVAIPMITESFVKKDLKGTSRLITDNVQMLFIFIIPAILGTILLARPLYVSFYGAAENAAISLFRVNLLLIFLQGLYALFGVVIQAIFENQKAILYFLIGIIVKSIIQLPFIYLFQAYGPLWATGVGLAVTTLLIYHRVEQVVSVQKEAIKKDTVMIGIVSLVMGVVVWMLELGLSRVLPPVGRTASVIHIVVAGSVGVLIYGYLTLKTRQLDKLIGTRASRLRKKLHIS
ncbi:polysaccharide biosynthesis protein [Streptococcus azizii]|uniref:Polysaccharide biosynthesis protein n=1 Tax=Streptococcus azizii TaxID=1579424 RepID=A0AB36JND2_9STRE|nr:MULTISPECIES: polysaccharide biosynthesis protein [Streptococcus]MBF0775457.1 polysaccharide biosynthesis protein [Streptococcus sp. 19428wD3_AN2]ONK28396.1 polysaccharide biosynthesis protein [Streptococcus azizii]ONK29011.1 polysaccharide biosynthesis protein [Streptococcus azizii]ONK30237.1 polysaccharide biosynthesis protein [Streptococcus azizii]TFU84622.1 polysaccharide biosynthesis protein [Streptococcus sp. AN2]